jgi:hypothetical protein
VALVALQLMTGLAVAELLSGRAVRPKRVA